MPGRLRDFLRGLRGSSDSTEPPAGRPASKDVTKDTRKDTSKDTTEGAAVASQARDIDLLSTQLRRMGSLDARPQQADASWMAALQRLWAGGARDSALRFGTALSAAIPTDRALHVTVADWLFRQGDGDAALRLLDGVLIPTDGLGSTQPASGQAVPDAVAVSARLLRSEVRLQRGDVEGSQADLADVLIADWPAQPGGISATALARYRQRAQAKSPKRSAPLPSAIATGPGLIVASAVPTLLGDVAQARYRLMQELGAGASGVVYVAEDAQLGCPVALKLFDARIDAHQVLDEAKLLSALQHPGVLALYDADLAGRFLTMELCQRGSLRARLLRGPLPVRVALQRTRELCDALASVHALAIFHGDIKPENLLFRDPARSWLPHDADADFGDLVISDFGIAQRISATAAQAERVPRGTRAYLAPERLHGQPGSPAADLYSVGVVLFEMLCGVPPSAALGQAPDDAELAQVSAAQPAARDILPFLRSLLSDDEAARPSAGQAQQIIEGLLTNPLLTSPLLTGPPLV